MLSLLFFFKGNRSPTIDQQRNKCNVKKPARGGLKGNVHNPSRSIAQKDPARAGKELYANLAGSSSVQQNSKFIFKSTFFFYEFVLNNPSKLPPLPF